MHTLSETAVHTAGVNVPDDGVDPRTAASLEPAFQALANRTKLAHDQLNGLETIPGNLQLENGFLAQAPCAFNDQITCLGDANVQGAGNFTGGLNVYSDGLIDGALDVTGNVTITGATSCAAQITLNDALLVYGATIVNNGLTVAAGLANFVDGSRNKLRIYAAPNFNASFIGKDYDLVVVYSAGGAIDYTVLNTSVRDGDGFRIINYTAQNITLKRADTTVIKTLATGFASPTWADVFYHSGQWRLGATG